MYFVIKSHYETLKKLSDYEMTFCKLKEEYCKSHDLKFEDTYFTDERNNIYLDSMVIKECLFPMDNFVLNYLRIIQSASGSTGEIQVEFNFIYLRLHFN